MRRLLFGVAVCAVGLVLVGVAPVFVQQSSAQTIGQRVDQAFGKIESGAQNLADRARQEFEKARAAVDQLGVEGRVYARIHWDKGMVGSSISVDVGKGGVTTLRGTVPTEAAKAKAAQLAGDTVGVSSVANQLKVVPANQ